MNKGGFNKPDFLRMFSELYPYTRISLSKDTGALLDKFILLSVGGSSSESTRYRNTFSRPLLSYRAMPFGFVRGFASLVSLAACGCFRASAFFYHPGGAMSVPSAR
jgi:hypothetical protein